jgi:hypothetical protein
MYIAERMVKTYACIPAIAISKPTTRIITERRVRKAKSKKLDIANPQASPARIFKRACPDIKFANNRIATLKSRAKYEINSIPIIKGIITNGVPPGRKREKRFHPWDTPPRIFKDRKPIPESVRVTIRWLVVVKTYGSIPKKFESERNTNKV